MTSKTVVGVFTDARAAEMARTQLIKEGYPASVIEIHHETDPTDESTPASDASDGDNLDGSAVGLAMGTGLELGALAAIPILGPLLASGPLQNAAQQSQHHLEHAFEDFGREPSPRITLKITTDHPDRTRDRLQALGATLKRQ